MLHPEAWARAKQKRDDALLKSWGMMRNPEPMILRYGNLTGYPTKRHPTPEDLERRECYNGLAGRPAYLTREEAIKVIAKEFKFQSPEAAYKALQRAGVKYLPSTWPKA